MKTCCGFVRAKNEASAWKACRKRVAAGKQLCAGHEEALASALLWTLEIDAPGVESAAPAKVCTCVGHAERLGGKPRRLRGSNRPRRSRVPQTSGE
jgi:hypothetical protein